MTLSSVPYKLGHSSVPGFGLSDLLLREREFAWFRMAGRQPPGSVALRHGKWRERRVSLRSVTQTSRAHSRGERNHALDYGPIVWIHMQLTLEYLRSEAEKLRAEHALGGSPLQHCHSLEIIAQRHGFANWRSARAALAKGAAKPLPKASTATATAVRPSESQQAEQPARPITSEEFNLAFRVHTLRAQVAREEQRVAAAPDPTGAQLSRLEEALFAAENDLASDNGERAYEQVTEGIAKSAQALREFEETKELPDRFLTRISGAIAHYVCLWERLTPASEHVSWTLDRYGRWAVFSTDGYDHDNDSAKADYSARREAARLGLPILRSHHLRRSSRAES